MINDFSFAWLLFPWVFGWNNLNALNEFCKFEKLHQIPRNEGSWEFPWSNCFLVKFLIYSHSSLTKGRSTQKLFSPELSEYWRPTLFEFKNISDWLHQWPSTFFTRKPPLYSVPESFSNFIKRLKAEWTVFSSSFKGNMLIHFQD